MLMPAGLLHRKANVAQAWGPKMDQRQSATALQSTAGGSRHSSHLGCQLENAQYSKADLHKGEKSKPTGYTPTGRPLSGSLTMPRTGQGVKRQEAASTAGGNADSHMQNAEILAGGHADAVQPLWKTNLLVVATLGALLPYKPADTLLGSHPHRNLNTDADVHSSFIPNCRNLESNPNVL